MLPGTINISSFTVMGNSGDNDIASGNGDDIVMVEEMTPFFWLR